MNSRERNLLIAILWALALGSFVISCTAGTSASTSSLTFVTPTPTPTASATPTPTPITGGPTPVPGAYTFAVTANYPTTVYSVLHKENAGWGVPCSVTTTGGTPGTSTNCLLEVEEGDLYLNDLTLSWSAGAAACNYVLVYPYWFYQYPAGYGATSISYTVNPEGVIIPSSLNQVSPSGGTLFAIQNNEIKCNFDHSWKSPAGPNACPGYYVETKTVITATSTVATTTTKPWGGKLGNAAAGMGASSSNWSRGGDQDLPVAKYFGALAGSSGTLSLSQPVPKDTALQTENYQVSPFPAQFASTGAVFGNGIKSNPYYIFECRDAGFEILGKLNIMIRGWNLATELAKGSLGVATTAGTEGVSVDPNNDLYNWEDVKADTTNFPDGYLYDFY